MVDKTEILKNEVDRILSDQGKSTICILINTDDYSGKFVKLAGEKLLLIDETDFIADNVCDSLERRMIEKYGLSKNNVEDLVSKGSEVNRELKRYIKSNRIINSILVGKMSCQTAEDELAEVKGNLTILVQQIQELIVIKNFQDICYLIYGKMSGNYLIERYLRESLSYDADLEDPLLYINSEIVDVGDFDKKKVLDSIQVDAKVQSLVSQMAQKESDAKELSIYWVQEAERLVRELKETYRDSLFDEKRLRRLEQNLRDAQQDIETGHYDSAIKTGRDTFRDAMEMKEDLAALDLEWNYRFNTLRNTEERLLEDLDSAEHRVYCIDTNDGTIEYDNGIDYWTNGQLTIIKNRIQKVREKMGNLQNATIDELTTYEQKINSLIEELALVENASHINVAMSLSRFQTAVKIGEILGDEFEMIDSDGDFYCEENREEYHAVYVNPATGDKTAYSTE